MDEPHSDALARLPDVAFRFADAADVNLSRWALARLVESGEVERIAHGLYRKVDAPAVDDDLVEAVTRAPEATLCLTSALAHWGLIDEIPDTIHLAIPNGHHRPAHHGPVTWHQFASETFTLGRQHITIDGTDLTIGIYSPERSIVDAYRLRHTAGYEVADEALREWLRQPGSTPAKILAVAAQLPRSQAPLRTALGYLA